MDIWDDNASDMEADAALFSSRFKRANPPTTFVRPGDEFVTEIPASRVAPLSMAREDSPAMKEAMARAVQAGREWRESKFYQPGFFGMDAKGPSNG